MGRLARLAGLVIVRTFSAAININSQMEKTFVRTRVAIVLLLMTGVMLHAQTPAAPKPDAPYYVVFLRPAADRKTLTKEEGERIQTAHMANIHQMAQDGVLVSAGPFDDATRTISGIFIFKVDSLEKAQAIAAKDPTVVEHRNTVDAHAWLGPAGIGDEYNRLHKLDPKTPENMQVHPFCMLYRGATWEEKQSERDSLIAAHKQYVDRLRADRKLSAAGAIKPPDELVGLVIFKAIPFDEAQKQMEDDPAVKAGVLRVEYHHWWSSDHVLTW